MQSRLARLITARRVHPGDDFIHALARETLINELQRITVLINILACALVGGSAVIGLNPPFVQTIFQGRLPLGAVFVAFGSILGYEILIRVLVRTAIMQSRGLPSSLWYGNAIVEMSLPTAMLWVITPVFGPIDALISPIPLLYVLFIVAATLHLDWRLCVVTGVIAAVEYSGTASVLLPLARDRSDPMLATLTPYLARGLLLMLVGGVAGFAAHAIRRQIVRAFYAAEERTHALQVFGQHVSPAVAEILLNRPIEPRGESRFVCLMFLDIRDFTHYAEQRSPQEVMAFLNSVFAPLIECISRHQGIINKFLGDGFLAVFGAPVDDSAAVPHAVAAAREILTHIAALNTGDPVRIGIGLHAGEVMTGTVGSPLRQEYTLIGDVVNVAARIEQLNKQFGSQLLISDAVWRQLPADEQTSGAALGAVTVKGHVQPVYVYQLA